MLVKPTTPTETRTGTNFACLNSLDADPTKAADDPSLKNTTLFFADRTHFAYAMIAQTPAQSMCTFTYYLAASPTVVTPTQAYKTRARALTIDELKSRGLAQVSAADIAYFQTKAKGAAMIAVGGSTSLDVTYFLATGALPHNILTSGGQYVNSTNQTHAFTDGANVGSTSRRRGTVPPHRRYRRHPCTGAVGSAYTSTAVVNGVHPWARDPAGREYASFYAAYRLAP